MIQESSWNNRGGIQISGEGWNRNPGEGIAQRSLRGLSGLRSRLSNQTTIRLILVISLVAFEVFNFDTSRFALTNFLGDVSFLGLKWATILAIAFCSIDFAGLAYLFSPERDRAQSPEVWYLMGAWLLGATMNALMTWWAVSLTLLEHDLGNEVVDRQRLLHIVPFFVAALVWLTRILFISAFSVAGGRLMLHFGGIARDKVFRPEDSGPTNRFQNPDGREGSGRVPAFPGRESAPVQATDLSAASSRREEGYVDDSEPGSDMRAHQARSGLVRRPRAASRTRRRVVERTML